MTPETIIATSNHSSSIKNSRRLQLNHIIHSLDSHLHRLDSTTTLTRSSLVDFDSIVSFPFHLTLRRYSEILESPSHHIFLPYSSPPLCCVPCVVVPALSLTLNNSHQQLQEKKSVQSCS
ncbi:hypothetical protein PGT21_034155 [Puccinia graminis f. sp. tritici]|uniref:Uncharacterized protein n=1 Tax=Puccinia graminis f. sp. tritici TaxID=56615 RepID=A0A5B0MZW4_PUCGR|nr:hypothetical protein PGT21_034155 [Puccinia graminis f. sp. tritici]KAA1081806.1 hypothetical protein PGTUg99_011170 [Puccinia graminis f. sp. tritici]